MVKLLADNEPWFSTVLSTGSIVPGSTALTLKLTTLITRSGGERVVVELMMSVPLMFG